jgi:TPR repeat protein
VAQKACNHNNGTMCYKLGLYHEKNGDDNKAHDLFKKACDLGQSASCKHLGDLYHRND